MQYSQILQEACSQGGAAGGQMSRAEPLNSQATRQVKGRISDTMKRDVRPENAEKSARTLAGCLGLGAIGALFVMIREWPSKRARPR